MKTRLVNLMGDTRNELDHLCHNPLLYGAPACTQLNNLFQKGLVHIILTDVVITGSSLQKQSMDTLQVTNLNTLSINKMVVGFAQPITIKRKQRMNQKERLENKTKIKY